MIFPCGKCKQKIDADTVPASGICGACLALPDMTKFVSLDEHTTLKTSHDKILGENRNLKAEAEANGRGSGDQSGQDQGGKAGSGGADTGKKGKASRFKFGTIFNLFADSDEDEAEKAADKS